MYTPESLTRIAVKILGLTGSSICSFVEMGLGATIQQTYVCHMIIDSLSCQQYYVNATNEGGTWAIYFKHEDQIFPTGTGKFCTAAMQAILHVLSFISERRQKDKESPC